MSQSIDKEKVTFLLYLDDPHQAEILDYLSELSPSRKGEVLRQILVSGWSSFKKNMNLESEVVKTVKVKQKPQKTTTKKKKAKVEPPRYPAQEIPETQNVEPRHTPKDPAPSPEEDLSEEERRLMESYGEIVPNIPDVTPSTSDDDKDNEAPTRTIGANNNLTDDDDDDDMDDLDRLKMKVGG